MHVGRDATIVQAPRPAAPPVVTHGLPRDVQGFTGRDSELDQLLAAAGPGRVVNVHAVDGMPGVGKTALIKRAAHRLAERFPDGQYFYDLHAHTPGHAPADPVDVLGVLLTNLGIDRRGLPPTLEGRAHLWRDRLAGKRVLLVLDDAAGPEQVTPLLPSGPDCLTLITSRRRLVALDDAEALSLAPLKPGEAAELFAARARRRLDVSEREAVTRTVRLCGHLPLAIVLLAGRLRHKPHWTVEQFASDVDAVQDRLGEFHDGRNPVVDAAFTLSYQDLPLDQQRLFRLIGLHPGLAFDRYAAAALDGAALPVTRRRLEALYTDHLLDEPVPGRYQPHDLLRAYARTLTTEHDTARDRTEAVERLMDHYQQTAQTADRYLRRIPRPGTPPDPGHVTTPELADRTSALTWMRVEHANLVACIDAAPTTLRAVDLTAAMAAYLHQDGPWPQAAGLHRRAAETARALHDPLREANATHALGRVHYLTGDNDDAARLQRRALTLYGEIGDRLGQANTLWDLARVRYLTGDYEEATRLGERALALYEDLGDPLGQANALWDLGRVRYTTADYEQAIRFQEQGLALYQRVGDRPGQADILSDLGHVRYLTGDYEEAVGLQERALALFGDLGNRLGQGNTLYELGCLRSALGDHQAALQLLQRALTLFDDLGNRHGQANALNELGHLQHLNRQYGDAAALLKRSLTLFQEVGDPQGQAEVLNHLGALEADASDPHTALDAYRQALRLARQINSRLDEARALEGTARCLARTGDHPRALEHLRSAVTTYRSIGAPEARPAAQYLARLEADDGNVSD